MGRSELRPKQMMERVNLRELKNVVRERLDPGDPLRELILGQPASLPTSEFLAKAEDWLALLDISERPPKPTERATPEVEP